MITYILIGVIFGLLRYRVIVQIFDDKQFKKLIEVLYKGPLKYLIKIVPIIIAVHIILLWPIYLFADISGYVASKWFKKRHKEIVEKNVKDIDNIIERVDNLTDKIF